MSFADKAAFIRYWHLHNKQPQLAYKYQGSYQIGKCPQIEGVEESVSIAGEGFFFFLTSYPAFRLATASTQGG